MLINLHISNKRLIYIRFFMTTECIGQGSYGKVFRTDKQNHVQKELKIWDDSKDDTIILKDANIRETTFYQLIKMSQHPQANKTCLFFSKKLPPSLQHIYKTQITLFQNTIVLQLPYLGITLSRKAQSKLSSKDCLLITEHIIQGLMWMHEHGISHGDLKPDNICILEDNKCSLIDFGSVCFDHQVIQTNQRCTIYYVSPEELIGKHYFMSNDIWSLGVVLFELYTGLIFVHQLMLSSGYDQSSVLKFHENAKHQQKQARLELTYFYKNLTYVQISNLLNEKIKNSSLFRLISHCLLISLDLRPNIQDVYKLFLSFKPVDDTMLTQHEHSPILQGFKSIKRMYSKLFSKAPISKPEDSVISFELEDFSLDNNSNIESSQQVIKQQQLITVEQCIYKFNSLKNWPYEVRNQCVDQIFLLMKPIPHLVLNAVMCFDRFMFRFLPEIDSQITWTDCEQLIVVCVIMISVVYQTKSVDLMKVKTLTHFNITNFCTLVLHFMETLDFLLINHPPGFSLTQKQLMTYEQKLRFCKQFILLHPYTDVLTQYIEALNTNR